MFKISGRRDARQGVHPIFDPRGFSFEQIWILKCLRQQAGAL